MVKKGISGVSRDESGGEKGWQGVWELDELMRN